MDAILIILSRWFHVATAAIFIGGVFFLRIVFPIALRSLDAEPARVMLTRTVRVFKMVVHTCVLLMLVSGTYNTIINWPAYSHMGKGLGHSLYGVHLLLGLTAMGIALWLMVGKEPRATLLKWLAVTLGVLFLTVAAASVLKYAREHPQPNTMTLPAAVSPGVISAVVVSPVVVSPGV